MFTTGNEIQYLTSRIEQKLQHIYLDKYIQKPDIDEDKLYLLYKILSNTKLSQKQMERYIVTTMLVQIALDIHDQIPDVNNNQDKDVMIKNQLSILAGDYYSGLYYLLLAEIDDFSFINKLASGIKEINVLKMTLQEERTHLLDAHISNIKELESLLITHVADFVNESTMILVTQEWLLYNRLVKELKMKINNNTEKNSLGDFLICNKCNLTEKQLEEIILNKGQYIKELLSELPDAYSDAKLHIVKKLGCEN
ncbi:heptaprenyl diphosphate synthase component 1 [Ornithinibacillus halophilus]|uniref:heptaprenyl diphosphate synthase component 1 n=1 Tax=Ornithinibacillus halophilus TaxID=930117 RepID=UPI0009349555|nr:heptaprenyl diphosphate synthase component 1 [Ornithinibacillus halophilus]